MSISLSLSQAGEKHFHPTCATCCKCGRVFGEGEDMCIAGEDIWHLDCDKSKAEAGIHTGMITTIYSIPIPPVSIPFHLSPFHSSRLYAIPQILRSPVQMGHSLVLGPTLGPHPPPLNKVRISCMVHSGCGITSRQPGPIWSFLSQYTCTCTSCL